MGCVDGSELFLNAFTEPFLSPNPEKWVRLANSIGFRPGRGVELYSTPRSGRQILKQRRHWLLPTYGKLPENGIGRMRKYLRILPIDKECRESSLRVNLQALK